MTRRIILNIITQHSIGEDLAAEEGNTTPKYLRGGSIVEMNPEDMKRLGIRANTNVLVKSEAGEVIVTAIVPTRFCPPGLAHIRQGAWSGQILPPEAHSAKTPQYCGLPVTIEPAVGERVKSGLELAQPGTDAGRLLSTAAVGRKTPEYQ